MVPRRGAIGPPVDPAVTTRAVEFNDLDALERELAHGDVACVLTEPALTNIGIVLPDPGFHEGLRALTRRYGTLLIIDETHTICAGPGGATRAWGLEPDLLTIGKPLASGIPAATYGMSTEVCFAAWMPAMRATPSGSALGTLPVRIALRQPGSAHSAADRPNTSALVATTFTPITAAAVSLSRMATSARPARLFTTPRHTRYTTTAITNAIQNRNGLTFSPRRFPPEIGRAHV